MLQTIAVSNSKSRFQSAKPVTPQSIFICTAQLSEPVCVLGYGFTRQLDKYAIAITPLYAADLTRTALESAGLPVRDVSVRLAHCQSLDRYTFPERVLR